MLEQYDTGPRSARPGALGLALCLGLACGDGGQQQPDASPALDHDGDGFVAEDDCDDRDRFVHPGAPEPCDGVDNDCDVAVDEDWDVDDDGWTTCRGDCRDRDATSYPGGPEMADGADNNCDGLVDNGTDAFDDDGDGWAEDQGDCNDDVGSGGAYQNPFAIEVQLDEDGDPEGLDNDCDGLVDEAIPPCPDGGARLDPIAFADAVDACHYITRATWSEEAATDDRARAIRPGFGDTYVPFTGGDLVVLSSGIAADRYDPGFVEPQSGTEFPNSVPHPDPIGAVGCSMPDQSFVNDYAELELRLQVPSNAIGFSFDFNFMSVEFPEYVCDLFDDTFLAMLESSAYTGNVSFDAQGNRVSINVGFFNVCDPVHGPTCTGNKDLVGTGHEYQGGGTGWLTTTAPVLPGEKITLRFVIFDEGDHILDSTVLIDNFRWEVEIFECPGGGPPPCTVDRENGPPGRFVTTAGGAISPPRTRLRAPRR